ncbi:MAG: hypothetical protein P8Z70_12175 [Desulfuromonadales bacterium]
MSSILKALKKLEQEKARRADGPVDIARDILRTPARGKKSPVVPAMVLSGLLILLAGFCWYFLVDPQTSPRTSETTSTRKEVPTAPVAAEPPTYEKKTLPTYQGPNEPPVVEKVMDTRSPATVAEKPDKEKSGPSISPPETTPVQTRTAISTIQPSARKAGNGVSRGRSTGLSKPRLRPADQVSGKSSSPAPVATVSKEPRSGGKTGIPTANTMQAPKSVADPPSLVVSGIAYLGDKSGRIAVVNDLPVMVGNLVDGARVEEILPDRVRFSKDGREFEVPLQER